LTGWGQQEDRRRAREAGFDEHLVKPADLDELRALVVSATPSEEVVDSGAPAARVTVIECARCAVPR
jgi:DNA-binding response OmpR family regulator